MANQSRGLVTQTAGDGNTLERAHDDIAKGFVIGGRRDLGQVNLITVDFEEIQEFIVILVVCRFMNMVREAFVTSVAWTLLSAPPLRL